MKTSKKIFKLSNRSHPGGPSSSSRTARELSDCIAKARIGKVHPEKTNDGDYLFIFLANTARKSRSSKHGAISSEKSKFPQIPCTREVKPKNETLHQKLRQPISQHLRATSTYRHSQHSQNPKNPPESLQWSQPTENRKKKPVEWSSTTPPQHSHHSIQPPYPELAT